MTTSLPIACTLTPDAHAARTTSIAELNRAFLRAHHREERALTLVYAPDAAARVRELVRRERECCAFLRFDVAEASGSVTLRVEVPAEADEAAGALLAPFLAGTTPARRSAGSRVAGVAAGASAAAAVACGVCCVLPFAFPAVTLTAAGGVLAAFAGAYRWALALAALAVIAGWLWVGAQSLRARRRPARATARAMLLATAIFALAASWPALEPHVVALLTR